MNIAKGSKSWIYSVSIIFIFFLSISFFINKNIRNIFFFISFIILLLTFFLIIFFRDPNRIIGNGITACSDGKIQDIEEMFDEDIGKCIKISTFMSIYNVHVNRMPLNGKIKKIIHITGLHIPAFKKESEKNERVITLIDTDIGLIKIIQIAGTIARRIVPYIEKGDNLKKGDKIGIIRLGSRVVLLLPLKKIRHITANIDDKVKAGQDTIAEIND